MEVSLYNLMNLKYFLYVKVEAYTTQSTTTKPVFQFCTSVMFAAWWINESWSSTAGPCVLAFTPRPPACRRTWHSLTEMHRLCPFTARWPTQNFREPSAQEKEPCGFFFLSLICKYLSFSATTSRLVSCGHQTFTWESWQRLKQQRRPRNKEAHL